MTPAGMSVPPPAGVRVVQARTADAMKEALLAESEDADLLLMAAAVSDWRPKDPSGHKVKKSEGAPAIDLEPTDDILVALKNAGRTCFRVGFALETNDVVANGQSKLREKDLDMIVINDATEPGAGFEVTTNRVTLLARDGSREDLPLMSKREVAAGVLDRVHQLRKSDPSA